MKISRRKFIELMFGFVASSAFFTAVSSFPKRELVRPPGAVVEDDFLSLCNGCGVCIDVCPTRGLGPATLSDGIANVGTPKLVGYCNIDCVKCMEVCPTEALQKITVDEKDMGTAVIVEDRCRAWVLGTCFLCVDRCPLDAIFSINERKLLVDTYRCNGCAHCVDVCPESPPAVYIIPEGANRIK